MVFKVILEPSEDGGYTALVPALPGCISEGNSVVDAMDNAREAIELYLEPIEDLPEGDGVLIKELAL
jgi:predicted RNase H-like HicB family nuclease